MCVDKFKENKDKYVLGADEAKGEDTVDKCEAVCLKVSSFRYVCWHLQYANLFLLEC